MHGYGAMQKATLSGRALEREVFARITARLDAADPERPGGAADFVTVLDENRRLWSTLAMDLAQPRNALPDALKGAIISLAAFVERQTPLVARRAADKQSLVDINRNVLAGLSSAPMSDAA